MSITLVIGTARKGRASERVAKALHAAFVHSGVEPTLVDVRDHVTHAETVPPWGEGGAKQIPTQWQQVVQSSDALVFILPEYNHGYPGEWKLLVDSLYSEYKGKAAYIVGVSDGTFSGVRVADHVKPVLVELGLSVQRTALYVGKAPEVINEQNEVQDEALKTRMEKFVSQVLGK